MGLSEGVRGAARNVRHTRAWADDYWYCGVQLGHGAVSMLRREDPEDWQAVDGEPGLPVVLLPGIYETWRMMRPVADALRAARHPVHVVPGVGLNLRSFQDEARIVVDHLRRTPELGRFAIVAHSKGGLVGKAAMLRLGDRVVALVTVATPFAGSSWASLVPPGAGIRSLGPGARGVRALSREAQVNARVVSLIPRWDPHIPDDCEVPGGTNIHLTETGHFAPLGSPEVHRIVVATLARLSGDAAQPR